ncbi:hypothetical protein DAVIS_05105 [Mycobacterium marinum]|uniref:Uncharacterized protein n=1 Tax=Mycobacterium marinum TaxID=1781 RepID=A0A3E2MP95_MYCMR|nr:hypothetical protein [Mycobacterium marinum]RFZ33273.1 hypothetical protein DAVIS_05105 [Mycobacterium marinum]GJO54846.1 hypothetical protein NJB1604_46310 [Mycobacterium marinum]
MLTPTLDLGATADGGTLRRTGADDDGLHYRVEVVAASVIDVVQAAGGWLCDRVMAGWQVRVLVPGGDDIRPLQILGATAMDLEAGLTGRAPMGHSLAVGAAAFAADGRVRAKVTEALQRRWTEVALWGQGWPLGVDRAIAPVQHVLSAAALAFKRQALTAAGIPYGCVVSVEQLLADTAWSG